MLVQNSNAFLAISNLLKKLDYSVDQAKLKHDLLSHPDYPSLLAINQVLHQYGIDYDAVEVDKDSLHEVPTPLYCLYEPTTQWQRFCFGESSR